MKVRADIAELLRAGHSNRAIARQLNVDAKTAAAARAVLGLPKAKSGYRGAATPEDLFWRRVRPVDGGHMEWTGFNVCGTPSLRHGGRNLTAYPIAYRIAHGRAPEGQALPSCGRDHCVKPGHHADRADRVRAQDRAAVVRAWARGLKKAARVLERERAKADRARERERAKAARAQEKRVDYLYSAIFGAGE
ncbi:hypothetical protein [Streptomyces sp. NPDC013455]|uniref:hypothetical protein n=1 Tax=Streptomyces sp. NPDC013455 TaxID=3155605 RepID=UPI0033DC7FE9